MIENRKLPRRKVDEPLAVFDPVTQACLGRLVNITVEGFLLYGERPLEPGALFQLDMPLPRPIDGYDQVRFGAEVVWSSDQTGNHGTWAGFHIIAISEPERAVIDNLIAGWGISDR